MVCLSDGLVCALIDVAISLGLWANLCRIEGDDWVNLAEVRSAWVRRRAWGGEHKMATELSDLKFGCPNLIQLPDGDVLAAFWCHENELSIIRWVRMRCR